MRFLSRDSLLSFSPFFENRENIDTSLALSIFMSILFRHVFMIMRNFYNLTKDCKNGINACWPGWRTLLLLLLFVVSYLLLCLLSFNPMCCTFFAYPLFWANGNLSTGGKIAIAISCLVVFSMLLLVVIHMVHKKGRHDCDFTLLLSPRVCFR